MIRIKTRLKYLVPLLCLTAGTAWAQAPAAARTMKKPAVVDFRTCAKPKYPHEEMAARHQGTVTLKFEVGADGKVTGSQVGRSSGFPALDEAARSALATCQFQPAIDDNGQPVATSLPVQYVWSLN